MTREELETLCLSVGKVEHAEALKRVDTRGLQRRVVVHLQLEDVTAVDQLAEDASLALDHAIKAEKGVSAICSLSVVGEHSVVETHEPAQSPSSPSVRRYIE